MSAETSSHGRRCAALGISLAAALALAAPASAGGLAVYLTQSGREHDEPLVRAVRIDVTGTEDVGGVPCAWWEFTAATRTGASFGVRILSERAALTSHEGVGRIERYLYRDFDGRVLEYRDAGTGRALLPMVSFRDDFLPKTARYAAFDRGWASAGTFLGHTIVRVDDRFAPKRAVFEPSEVLVLRPDFLIATQINGRNDDIPLQPGDDPPASRPYTRGELETMIEAGVNFFHDAGDLMPWLMRQPVFYQRAPSFTDSFYRSNHYMGRMYLDEPAVRFGWDEEVPGAELFGPEQHAESVRRRVESEMTTERRRLPIGPNTGTLDLFGRNAMSWDTYYYTAWYQLSAGASSITHEGRYRDRGYGWSPEAFYGEEGLEELTFADQLHYLNAFIRGAARAFDAEWGVSVYPEGERGLFAEAYRTAYDMGARHFWYWTHPPMTDWPLFLDLARTLTEHAARSPRGSHMEASRQATVGIVLPRGYTITPDGSVWGCERDRMTRGGVTYGDVAASALGEGILCSRRGIAYDYLVDEPFARDLGYERLVILREDGSMEAVPPWPEPRQARLLHLALEDDPAPDISERAVDTPDYRVVRAPRVAVDGNLVEWHEAKWIELRSSVARSDLVDLQIVIPNVASPELWEQYRRAYLGFEFTQLNAKLREQFHIEDVHIIGPDVVDENRPGVSLEQGAVVVTEVRSGSPAAEAGLRPGDVIRRVDGRETEWEFVVHGVLERARSGSPETVYLDITRNPRERAGYEGDLSADVALMVDDGFLYLAARVEDDVHAQPADGWYLWQGDCLQLGLTPTLARGEGYGEQDHEIGLSLMPDGAAVAWRYHGRRGQPRGPIEDGSVAIVRENDQGITWYEAAFPMSAFMPIAPDLWRQAGFNIVVNDNDGDESDQRKGRLELVEGAVTRGKRTAEFAVLEFEPSPDPHKVSGALLWRRRATPESGFFRLLVAARSAESREGRIEARLHSLDCPGTPPASSTLDLPLSPRPREWSLRASTESPPGRYALWVGIRDAAGNFSAADRLPVLVYPAPR